MRDAFNKTETEKPNSKNLLEKEKEILPDTQPISLNKTDRPPAPEKRPTPPPAPEPAVRCSVIQRTPAIESKLKDDELKITIPRSIFVHRHPEPEQEQPIDYHVPKRREYDEEQEKRTREARRNSAIKGGRPLSAIYLARAGKLNGIISAAAGHGRSNGSSQQSGTNQTNNQNCGGSINFNGSGGSVSQGGSGGVGGGGVGGTGAGGGMGGRDGRSNYGPNSPPTGSLPPFYESLKGGNNGMNAYNAANGQYMSQNGYNLINNMDCDTTQELTNLGGYSDSNQNKNYALLQNHSGYGISLKSEDDLEYDTKMDGLNLLQSSYSVYDVNESMMVDIGAAVVDPLQFTATLTFSSPAEHALMESLSDAVDLSSFLQRLPNDDHHSSSDNLDLSSTPSLTPDSVSITAIDSNGMEPFTDHMMLGRYDRNGYIPNKMYHENPPSYQTTRDMMMSHQQHEHQMISSNGLGFNNLDIDQHSDLSLPSPGASCDGGLIDDKRNVQQNVSSSLGCDRPIKQEVLSQRVSILCFV